MRVDCKQCGIEFETNKELEEHEMNEHKFGCQHCEKTFQVERLLEEHISNYHKIQPRALVQCAHCAKIFRSNKLLNQHKRKEHMAHQAKFRKISATTEVQNCSRCGKTFKNVPALANHLKNAHNENESSDDDFEKATAPKEADSVAGDIAKNVEDYDDDEVYNEESSPDEEKMSNENAETANEDKAGQSLEEEQNRLSKLQEQLKMVRRGKTSLEQNEVLNKEEESGLVKESQKVEAMTTIKSALAHGRDNLPKTSTSKIPSPNPLECEDHKPAASIRPRFAKVADQIRSRVQKDRQLDSKQVMARLPSSSKEFFSNQTNKSHSLGNVPEESSVPKRNLLTQGQKSADVIEESKVPAELDIKDQGTVVLKSIKGEQKLDQKVLASGAGSDVPDKELQGIPCEICGFKFSSEHQMSRHMKLCAGDSNYNCDHCGHPFIRRFSLRRHMRENPSCARAKEGFEKRSDPAAQVNITNQKALVQNSSNKVDQKIEASPTTDLQSKESQNFPCEKCGYNFKKAIILRRHAKFCTGNPNYRCAHCGYPYKYRDSLNRHMRENPSCARVLEPKTRKKCAKRTLKIESDGDEAWELHGIEENQTEMLFVSTTTKICR